MKIKTNTLTGPALDCAVDIALTGRQNITWGGYKDLHYRKDSFSTSWSGAGPIIEREEIAIWPDQEGGWFASADEGRGQDFHAQTALIAAMRCFVASRLGDEVEVPNELC